MAATSFALFDTSLGCCGIAWSGNGIVGVQLPEADVAKTRARLAKRFPEGRESLPPSDAAQAIQAIVAMLDGEPSDFAAVRLDMDGVPPFHRRVYAAAREIPPGATLSYGEIATQLAEPGAARAVGQALGQNPFPIIVPCHRVLAAGGKTGGFSANGGVATKLRILSIEAAHAVEPGLFAALPFIARDPRRL